MEIVIVALIEFEFKVESESGHLPGGATSGLVVFLANAPHVDGISST